MLQEIFVWLRIETYRNERIKSCLIVPSRVVIACRRPFAWTLFDHSSTPANLLIGSFIFQIFLGVRACVDKLQNFELEKEKKGRVLIGLKSLSRLLT